jgi:hypothetical protein
MGPYATSLQRGTAAWAVRMRYIALCRHIRSSIHAASKSKRRVLRTSQRGTAAWVAWMMFAVGFKRRRSATTVPVPSLLLRQYLYFCTSKTSELSTDLGGWNEVDFVEDYHICTLCLSECVSICAFVLVKQVKCVPIWSTYTSSLRPDTLVA